MKTYVSALMDEGINLNTIGEFVGHTDEKTTLKCYNKNFAMLIACIGTSAIIVICNIIVVVAMESTQINLPYDMRFVDRAWLATVFWVPIGWIPNVVASVLLRKCGKKYLILKIISWVLYFLVGPTGICNPIPMSV